MQAVALMIRMISILLAAVTAATLVSDASADFSLGQCSDPLQALVVSLESDRGKCLAGLRSQPTVAKWLRLAEVQEELGRAYA